MKPILKFNDLDERLARRMYKDLLALNPLQSEPKFDKWAHEIRLLREAKKIDHMAIFKVWEWANKHEFWQTNILSAGKLRKQFDALVIQKTAAEGKLKKVVERKNPQCRTCGKKKGIDTNEIFISGQCWDCYSKAV